MKEIIDIPEEIYNGICQNKYTKLPWTIFDAIAEGTLLPNDFMILDRDKLEKDSDYSGYYDAYCAYSDIAIEAAQIEL